MTYWYQTPAGVCQTQAPQLDPNPAHSPTDPSSPKWITRSGWTLLDADDPAVLALLKARRVNDLKQQRDQASSVMDYDTGTDVVQVQTDTTSQVKLLGAMGLAQTDPDFFEEWTLADNSKLTLDATGMIALAVAAGQHIKVCHDRYDTLRTQINTAADPASLDAIDIAAGWP